MHAVAAFFASIITFVSGFLAPAVASNSPIDVRATQPAAAAAVQTEIAGNPFNDAGAASAVAAAAAATPARSSQPPPAQTVINQPVIERIVERVVPQGSSGISTDKLTAILTDFGQSIEDRIAALDPPKAAIPEQVAAAGSATGAFFPASQRIDQLTNTTINTPAISGGTISGTSIAGYLPLSGGTLAGSLVFSDGFLAAGSSTVTAGLTSLNGGASTTALTNSGTTWFTGLTSSLLGTDQTGKLVATTSISVNYLTGILPVANGGTATSTQVTNGVNFFDGTRITSGTSLSFDGTKLTMPRGAFSSTFGTTTIAAGQGLTIGSTQFVLQQGSGNVGIGTNAPTKLLDVGGTGRFGSTLSLGTVTSCVGGNALQTDSSGNISCGAISVGGSATGGGWTTNATGRVSLATSTDLAVVGASTTPYAKFSILSGASATTTMALVANAGQTANLLDVYSSGGSLYSVMTAGGSLGLGTTSPGSLLSLGAIANFTTATSTFYASGGINLAAGCFAISGNCLSFTNLTGTLGISQGGTGTTTQMTNGVNFFDGTRITSGTALTFDGTALTAPRGAFSSTSGTTTIAAGQGFTIGTSQFVLQQGSGNVGIGTTSPAAALHVDGPGGDYRIRVSAGSNAVQTEMFADTAYLGGVGSVGTRNNYPFLIRTNDLERMYVATNGHVGIGALPPSNAQLYVVGDSNVDWSVYGTAGKTTGAGVLGLSQNNLYSGYLGYSNNWGVYCYGAQCGGNVAWTNASDARLKTAIQDIDASSTLASLMRLRPITYHWKDAAIDAGRGEQLGFIAQEVEPLFPDLVTKGASTTITLTDGSKETISDPKALDYSGFVVPLVKAVQEIASVGSAFKANLTRWLGDAGNGIDQLFAKVIHASDVIAADRLCVGRTCVTEEQFIAMVAAAGQSAVSPSPGAPSATSQAPVIELNGNATSTIQVGDTYADLGARITGPQSDLNLGIVIVLDGATTTAVSIDTAQPGEHTILYTVTSPVTGLTGTAVRTVIVSPAEQPPPSLEEETNPFNLQPANDNASATSLLTTEPAVVSL